MKWIVALALLLGPAAAHAACVPHEDAVQNLKREFDEQVVAIGVAGGGGSIFEIFSSQTGSWTVLETYPDGTTCGRASGELWTVVETAEPGV